jgi:hypothetical protein
MQSGSIVSHLGVGGNVGQAARMKHGDIQQAGTMGLGKRYLNVGPSPLTANRCNANGSVTGMRSRIEARAGGDAAESFLPVVVSAQAVLLRQLQLMAWSSSLP